ncbi:response regulator [Butyrivibrio sp. JL13D10]|uniref:response regulator n=1 Tax=Butyrivibrio sp. JL13D10 TaxID=3236815 RepID=UPI0038B61580
MNKKALIVDDSELDRFFVKKLLGFLGLESDEAVDGKECLEAMRLNEYVVVFMDYLMPKMTGVQTLYEIKENGFDKNGTIPLIALVSPDDSDEGKLCLEAGFTNYLEKPVDFKQLTAVLIMYLSDDVRAKLKISSTDREDEFRESDHSFETSGIDTTDEAALNDENDIIKNVSKVPEIDYKKGISLCGSEEGYITALDIFFNSIDVKADEIERYFKNEDFENYTIKVHALKSSANLIGADKLWSNARDLEAAGNNNDIDKIKNETDVLLRDYRAFKDKLSFMSKDTDEEKAPVPESTLSDAYASLLEIIDAMDFDLADMVIKSMKEYKLPEKDASTFKELERLLTGLNWEGMKKLIDER